MKTITIDFLTENEMDRIRKYARDNKSHHYAFEIESADVDGEILKKDFVYKNVRIKFIPHGYPWGTLGGKMKDTKPIDHIAGGLIDLLKDIIMTAT